MSDRPARWMPEGWARRMFASDAFCGVSRVYAALWFHRNQKSGRCDPSIKTLAELTEQSERSVQRAIGALVKSGMITVTRSAGGRNAFDLTPGDEGVTTLSPPTEVSPPTNLAVGGDKIGGGGVTKNGQRGDTCCHPNIENILEQNSNRPAAVGGDKSVRGDDPRFILLRDAGVGDPKRSILLANARLTAPLIRKVIDDWRLKGAGLGLLVNMLDEAASNAKSPDEMEEDRREVAKRKEAAERAAAERDEAERWYFGLPESEQNAIWAGYSEEQRAAWGNNKCRPEFVVDAFRNSMAEVAA